MIDRFGRHRCLLGQRPLSPLARCFFTAARELFLGRLLVAEIAVDRRDLALLGLRAEQLALKACHFGLEARGAGSVGRISLGELVLQVSDELLLLGDERLLSRDDREELVLARDGFLAERSQLGVLSLELRDQLIACVDHIDV
jgi:hypothetical protein